LSAPQKTGSADQTPGRTMASGLKVAAQLETVGSR